MMADTNATPNGTSGEAVPQWKKELLQRRKNLAKTIGAASVPVHDSASTVAAALTTPTTPRAGPGGGNPFGSSASPNATSNLNSSGGGQKDPSGEATSSSPPATSPSDASPRAALALVLVDNSNRDSPASPTAAFGTPVFVGHSPSSPGNELPPQQQVLVKSLGRPATNTATREATGVLHGAAGTSEKQPLQHTQQSHSNDGPESTSIGSSNSRAVAAAPNSGPVGKYAAAAGAGVSGSVECEQQQQLTRPASGETNSYSSESWKLKKNTSSASSPNGGAKMVAASAEEIVYEKNRFVGNNGTGTGAAIPGEVDSAEELKYGPGIVSKLRCRYLSLALRQSANKQRPSLNSMRRATSLNNLLDEESEDLSERETSIEAKDHSQDKSHPYDKLGREQHQNQLNLRDQQQHHQQKAKTPDEYISTFQKSVQNSYTRSGRQTEKKNEYNRYNKQRGADSLKRARSVEALVRYDHKAWERDIQKENLYSSNDSNVIILDEICSNGTATNNSNNINSNGNNNNCQSVAMNKAAAAAAELIVDCVTIEEKIINGREKGDPKPKRLTSFIDADERPPPDVVRQTMKIFEANANRRGRPVARTNGAAGEVAAKVASYKSIISHEKPPITHPKPPLSPKKPNIIPRSASPKSNGTTNTAVAATNGLKDKPPMLPKLDLNVIRTNLETTNNAKNAATPPPIQNNAVTSTPLSVRVEPPQAYRLKYESPALSPNNTTSKVTTTTTTAATNRAESPRFSTATPALPASMQNNTNSTAATFVDSPSIQALTSKLNALNVATSTPTSTRSPTPSDPAVTAATPTPPQAPPRGVLQYTTSDEEEDDPDDPEQREYSINSDRGSDSQPDDLELDESADDDDEPDTSKTVSRAAMDNIAKAGVTTQFRFNGQGGGQNKSHLPGHNNNGGGSTGVKLLASKRLNVDEQSSNSSSTSSSPITVPAAVVVTQKPPVPLSRESLSAANGLKSAAANSSVTANSNSLSNHSSSNANTSVNTNGSKQVINASSDSASAPSPLPHTPPTVSSDVKTASLTAREIEKNQINLEKSGSEEASEKVVLPPVKAPNSADTTGSGGGDFFMAKWGSPAAAPTAAPPAVPLVKKKVKAPPPPTEANTMVFNFSDRKEVPDYIENDGIILRPRPRELPKPGESGFVVLGDLTLETSTDPDDSWAMGPPSPCDVEFANANIVINGKSSMRNKTSRDSKFKIQFDDSLTSTFEYPSETSLLETNGFDAAAVADRTLDGVDAAGNNGAGGGGGGFPDNGLLSHKNTLLSSMPLGSAPFASYTPVKAAIDTTFELGVTRTPSPSSSSSSSSSSTTTTASNEHPALANGGTTTTTTNGITPQPQQQRFNGLDSTAALQDSGEPESIQYLKPASDEQTVNWSQGTRVTDLLF